MLGRRIIISSGIVFLESLSLFGVSLLFLSCSANHWDPCSQVRKRDGEDKNNTWHPQMESPNFKQTSTRLKSQKAVSPKPCKLWLFSLVVLLLCHILTPGHCFFFPKSLFRRLSGSPQQQQQSPTPQTSHRISQHSQQSSHQHTQQEPLVGAEQQVNPIFTRGQFSDQLNPSFHVPKALCIACEKFPWMPVAGPEKPEGGSGGRGQSTQQDERQVELQSGSNDPPPKTIVISALGEAKGPVPPPPAPPQQQQQQANRKPFAIQFESSPVQNSVGAKEASGGYPSDNAINESKNRDPATRPISFQIYDPPRKPTVLQPVSFQQQSGFSGFSQHQPAPFMQPPPNVAFQFQQSQQNFVFRPPSVAYGRPTVLQPVNNVSNNPPSPAGGYGHPRPPNFVSTNVANNNSPIPPITIGTIVAAQQGGPSGGLPTFHEIQPGRLVYQEHTQVHTPQVAPFKNINPRPQKQPHNIKLPIIPKPFGRPSQGPQGGYQGPPPPQQQRPTQGGYQGPPPPQQQGPTQGGYQGPPPPQQQGPSPQSQGGYQGPPPPPPKAPQGGYQGPPPPPKAPQGGYQGPPPPQQGYQGQPSKAPQPEYQGPPPPPSQGPQQGYQGPPPPAPQQGYQGPPPPQKPGGSYQGPPPPQRPQGGYQGPLPQGGYQGPPPPAPRPHGSYQGPSPQQRPQPEFQGPPPPIQFSGFEGGYLPALSSEGGRHQLNIINLRAPPPPPAGQVFFPRPQATLQYGGPQGSPHQQNGPPPQSGQNVEHSSRPPHQRQPQSEQPPPPSDLQGSGSHSSKSPSPTNDYHFQQSGSHVQSQREQSPQVNNNVFFTKQVSYNPSKGIVKNPHIQSIDQPTKAPIQRPNEPTSSPPHSNNNNENGWEIIPAVQTDITHLFKTPAPTEPVKEVTVPLPVPIPIPQSHSSKSPIFIVRGQGSPQGGQEGENGKIYVQGITYHEEKRGGGGGAIGGAPTPLGEQEGPSPSSYATSAPPPPPPPQYFTRPPQELPRLQPVIRPGIILRPHPNQLQSNFDPLPASISTALYHAQRTSYLTHQGYVGQGGGGEKTVYVHSIPVRSEGGRGAELSSGNNDAELSANYEQGSSSSGSSNATHVPSNEDSAPRESNGLPTSSNNNVGASGGPSSSDQLSVNCQTHQQWVSAGEGKNHGDGSTGGEGPTGESPTASAPTVSGDVEEAGAGEGGRKPVLFYYPTPVQQSSIYWVQPPQSSPGGGIVRLQPHVSIPNYEGEGNSLAFSPPLRSWSQKVTQSEAESRNPMSPQVAQGDKKPFLTNGGNTQNESDESDREPHDDYSSKIPFGQKLSVSRPTVTPFDIISVGGKDESLDDSRAQSLEQGEDSGSQGSSAHHGESSVEGESGSSVNSEESSAFRLPSNSQEGSDGKGQINTLNEFSPQEGNVASSEGSSSGGFVRPGSTTVYHVPDSSLYATQSFRFPNFRPQQVYVHDFTQGGGRVTSIFEPTQQEDRTVGEQSQNVQSWRAFYNQPQKGPKIIDNYPPENDSDEERQFLVPSQKQPHREITSGTVTTAECSTAQTEPLTVTSTTTTATEITPTDTGREKIRLRVGTRFPGGRPSVTSFNVRTTEKTTTTSEAVVHDLVSSSDDNDSVNPGSFSASISIPVYRPAGPSREISSGSKVAEDAKGPPNNLLNLGDIYKKSEMKQHSEAMTFKPSTTESETSQSPTTEESIILSTMSTEKSSSFSISVDERMVDADNVELDANKPRKVPSNHDGQKVEIKDLVETFPARNSVKSVQIVTSSPLANPNEFKPQPKVTSTSETTTPSSSANTSTKIVKTVRVRQRMRPGSGTSGFHGAIRNRFNGAGAGGRIRVVHRPVTPDYVKVFPELSSSHTDKLAKEEEEEVKKALIELKRSERTNHTNHREFDLFHI